VVAIRGRIEWHQPDAVDAELRQVRQFPTETEKVTDAVAVGIAERLHVEAVEHRILVPRRHPASRRRDVRLVGGPVCDLVQGETGRRAALRRRPSLRANEWPTDHSSLEREPL